MKLLIAGSRTITEEYFNDCIKQIPIKDIDLIITGGASGVDTFGYKWAKRNNIKTQVVYPDWKQYGKAAGPIRNKQMVDMLNVGDMVFIIWDGKSKGTKNTINLTKKFNVYLFQNILNMKAIFKK